VYTKAFEPNDPANGDKTSPFGDEIRSKTLCFKVVKYTFGELLKHMKSKNIFFSMLINSGKYIMMISQFYFH
jgi:hypothetical protein